MIIYITLATRWAYAITFTVVESRETPLYMVVVVVSGHDNNSLTCSGISSFSRSGGWIAEFESKAPLQERLKNSPEAFVSQLAYDLFWLLVSDAGEAEAVRVLWNGVKSRDLLPEALGVLLSEGGCIILKPLLHLLLFFLLPLQPPFCCLLNSPMINIET